MVAAVDGGAIEHPGYAKGGIVMEIRHIKPENDEPTDDVMEMVKQMRNRKRR